MKRDKLVVIIVCVLVVAIFIGAVIAMIIAGGRNDTDGSEGTTPTETTISNGSTLFDQITKEEYGYSEDRDSDGDGLNDYLEHTKFGTNPFSSDTDSDYLSDVKETELGTDPVKYDTDGDGIADGLEVKAGTDPLKEDSDVVVSRILEVDGGDAGYSLTGNANIYEAVMEKFEVPGLQNTPGVVSEAYWVYSSNNYKGELSITVDGSNKDVAIYKLENTAEYSKVKTEVEEVDGSLKLKASVGNGKYLVGVCSFLDDYKETKDDIDVFLLIDDSGSMYNEMMEGRGNDPEYKRIEMCRNLLNNAPESIQFGLATFTATYMEKSGFTTDRDALLGLLNNIKDVPYEDKQSQFNGTYIATSIYNALDNFSKDSAKRQVLVVLTDGETTEGSSIESWFDGSVREGDAIKKAQELGVSIITVALGTEVDVDYLSNIESSTYGAYVYANSADAMEDLYAAILNAINFNYVDEDDDGEADVIVVADSGFRPSMDGFFFRNPIVSGEGYDSFGICYGISTFSSLYYQNKLSSQLDDLDITDWELWWLRYIVDAFADPVMPYVVDGFTAEDFKTAGFEVDENGNLTFSEPLGNWMSSEMTKYVNYFNWDYESDYFTEDKKYTEKALKELEATDYMRPIEYGSDKVNYPTLDLSVDEGTLSGESLKAHALLRILMRYQMSQVESHTRSGYTYTMESDLETINHTIESGVPLVLCTADHAVTLCKIRRDIEDPRLYYLDLYDSNYGWSGTTMEARLMSDSDGNAYYEYTYGSKMTGITLYSPHF